MTFLHHSFKLITWERNEEILEIVNELQDVGVLFKSQDQPFFQPQLARDKTDIALLIFLWGLEITNSNDEIVIEYVAEDRFQFHTKLFDKNGIKELILPSYQRFESNFHVYNHQNLQLEGGIPQLEQDELYDLNLDILQFLKDEGL